MANTDRPQLVLVVDTGTDDAGALIWAATDPRVDLVAVVADWGNVDVDLTARNTLDVLHAAGRDDVPVFRGGGKSTAGANPARFDASIVMGTDGLNGVRLARAPRQAEDLGGAALVDLIRDQSHTCYLGERGARHDWGYGCGECPACRLRARGWQQYRAARAAQS